MSTTHHTNGILWKAIGSRGLVFICTMLIALAVAPLHAQFIYTDLHELNCDTDGCSPYDYGQLAQGADGNLYGTAWSGGTYGTGTIFMITPSGAYAVLYNFDGPHGSNPNGGLTLANDGNFYGTTYHGGKFGYGAIFRFAPPNTLTVLFSFHFLRNGDNPLAPPIQGADGNLYGGTSSGAIYRLTLPAGSFQLLGNGLGQVADPLYLASDGNLYGTTYNGGNGGGTIFRVTGDQITDVYSFQCGYDGCYPIGPLTQGPGSDTTLYGTTESGGLDYYAGNVFKMTLSGTLSSIYYFDGGPDGCNPYAGVLSASDGFLYGANSGCGNGANDGSIYQITTTGSSFQTLYDFSGPDGSSPQNTPIQHTNGCIYGTSAGYYSPGNVYSECSQNNIVRLVKIEGPIFVLPGVAVQILGDNLTETYSVAFAGETTSFRAGSDTVLTAQVPQDAVDGYVTVTYVTGAQVQTVIPIHIMPMIASFSPKSGAAGAQVQIDGGGFAGATQVTFGGVNATFRIVGPTQIVATVPPGASTGKIVVTTPNGTATSKTKFRIT
jgi:uncharacterized repeat protein (TIGR03803 family)